MKTLSHDVAIIGAGPAGAAVALTLREHAPSLSVAVIEQSDYRGPGKGESLPPTAQPLLEQLGVWEAFLKDGHLPAYGTCAAWGSDQLFEHEFILHPDGRGWHLDRMRFDAMLAREAANRGVTVYSRSKFKGSQLTGKKRWRLSVQTPDQEQIFLDAGFVVDATGRRAVFAGQQQVKKVLLDRLVAVFVFFGFNDDVPLTDTYTLVEAWEEGWWYSALVPEERVAVACITDADIVKRRELKNPFAWFELMNQTRHVSNRVRGAEPLSTPVTHAAHSHRLEKMTGEAWLAVGDAASTFDPLSSQGILKGMRNGVIAAYTVSDYFNGAVSGLPKYEAVLSKEFEAYLNARTEFYRQEQRWEKSLFWQRRYDYITLDPDRILRLSDEATDAAAVEKLSMHLPAPDLKDLCDLCRSPRAAREVVSAFTASRKFTPDRRVILALQYLVEAGVINLATG